MILILTGTCFMGVITNRVLHFFHISSIVLRYPVAVFMGYLTFFFLMKVWLKFTDPLQLQTAPGPAVRKFQYDPVQSLLNDLDGVADAAADTTLASEASEFGEVSLGGGSSGDSDFVGLVLVGAFVAVLAGCGGYLIYAAPEILGDAAFNVVLSSSLLKSLRRSSDDDHWAMNVFAKTFLTFLVVMGVSLIFGLVVYEQCPQADTLSKVLKGCHTAGSSRSPAK